MVEVQALQVQAQVNKRRSQTDEQLWRCGWRCFSCATALLGCCSGCGGQCPGECTLPAFYSCFVNK